MSEQFGINKITTDSGNEWDLDGGSIPTGTQMGGVDLATTANISTSFVLGDAETGVTVGADKFVYLDSADGKVKEALASDIDSTEQVYFTISGSLANGFPVSVVTEVHQVFGLTWETGQTPTVGENFYLSDSEAGNVTHTAPANGVLLGELVDDTGSDEFVVRLSPQVGQNAIGESQLQDNAVTEAKLSSAVQTKLNDTATPTMKVYKQTVEDDSSGTVEMIAAADLATGNEIWDVRYVVTEAFDQASTLELGVSADTDAVEVIDLTATVGVLQTTQSRYIMTQSEALNLTYTANGATAGAVDVYAIRVIA